jgi:hypothetical protein
MMFKVRDGVDHVVISVQAPPVWRYRGISNSCHRRKAMSRYTKRIFGYRPPFVGLFGTRSHTYFSSGKRLPCYLPLQDRNSWFVLSWSGL